MMHLSEQTQIIFFLDETNEKPCLGFSGSTVLYTVCFCDLTAGLGLATGEISGLTEQKSFGELLSDHVLGHSYL